MPAFKFFKTFEIDNLGAGAVWSFSWTLEEDYVIRRIFVIGKGGVSLTKSTLTILVDNVPITREKVPAQTLGPDIRVSPELNLALKKAQKIDVSFNNLEGTTVSLFVVFEVYSP